MVKIETIKNINNIYQHKLAICVNNQHILLDLNIILIDFTIIIFICALCLKLNKNIEFHFYIMFKLAINF